MSHSVLLIGHNDFSPLATAYGAIYNGLWTETQIGDYADDVVTNITTALEAALAKSDIVVLSTFADYGVAPVTKDAFPNASQRDLVSVVIDDVNKGIRDLAEDRELVLVDMHAMSDLIFGTNQEPNGTLTVGGFEIDLDSHGTDPSNAYCYDKIHPHTAIQGVLANLFIEGLNKYDAGLTPFTETEILSHAGLTGTGANTLPFDVQEYVIDYTPEPATLCLLLPGLVLLRRKSRQTKNPK